MEDPELDWEIQEHESEGHSGKTCWGIVDRALSLGKKILVTGVVLSSAPLVLPPLLVISAIGFAFSVPAVLFLASYVCTEKLMGKLLPRTTPPPLLLGFGIWSNIEDVEGATIERDIDYEREEEDLRRDIKGEIESKFELSDKENEKFDYGKGSVGAYGKELSQGTDEIVEDVLVIHVKDEQPVNIISEVQEESDSNVVVEETPFELTKVAVELCLHGDAEEDKEVVRETRGLLGKLQDEGDSVDVELSDVANIVEEGWRPLEEKQTVLQAEKADEITDKNDILVNVKKKILQFAEEDVREIADESEFGLLHEKDTPAQPIKTEAYIITEGREAIVSPELPSGEGEVETNQGGKSSKKNTSMGSKEHYSVKEIWKQINAMRIIVGYKAAPQATYVEELKALYVFTGVEPPASLEERSDLEGVNDKLQFLKYIVGVK